MAKIHLHCVAAVAATGQLRRGKTKVWSGGGREDLREITEGPMGLSEGIGPSRSVASDRTSMEHCRYVLVLYTCCNVFTVTLSISKMACYLRLLR